MAITSWLPWLPQSYGATLALGAGLSLLSLALLFLLLAAVASDRVPSFPIGPGSHIIITGGSSGIGLSAARVLVAKGVDVTIIAREQTKLRAAETELKRLTITTAQIVRAISADVSDCVAITKAIDEAVKGSNGHLSALIASAGVTYPQFFLDMDPKNIDRLAKINYLGVAFGARASIPHLKQNGGGRIVFVSSILGLMGFPAQAAYCASKYAVHGFAEALALEHSKDQIYFSLACPSNVDTPMFAEENKTKPLVVQKLEGAYDVLSPDTVAMSIIDSFDTWRFVLPSHGLFGDTWALAAATGGMRSGSFAEVIAQIFFAPILRIVGLFEAKKYRKALAVDATTYEPQPKSKETDRLINPTESH